MEGPRGLRGEEFPSLSRLMDTVFVGRPEGVMFSRYPQLFNVHNLANLLVFTDGGEVVSHAGMLLRWATLGGCTVRAGLVGAVGTREDRRGQGLASRLLEAACHKARENGADFMLISGRRGLYRRYGAAEVGMGHTAHIHREHAKQLALQEVRLRPFEEHRLDACAGAYQQKPDSFLRPWDDWEYFLTSRHCMNEPAEIICIFERDVFAGYFVLAKDRGGGQGRILEYAGCLGAIASALGALFDYARLKEVEFFLESGSHRLGKLLVQAGCVLRAEPYEGTLLLLNFPQLMERLRPLFETRIGQERSRGMRFTQDGERFVFGVPGQERTITGRRAAAEFLFGNPHVMRPEGVLSRLFPVPTLWYGLNYI